MKYKCVDIILMPFVLGIVLTFAFAPFDIFIAIPISFTNFLFLLEKQKDNFNKQFYLGFCYGMGHFTSSLYWVVNALLIEDNKFIGLVPFAVLLIPGIISCFIGILSITTSYFIKASRIVAVFGFASIWVIIETLRSYIFTPFPWNLLGYASHFSLPLMQLSSIIGVYGLGFLLALCGASLYSRSIKLISIVCLIFIMCYAYGRSRISTLDALYYQQELLSEQSQHTKHINPKSSNLHTISVRIIQPNLYNHHFGNEDKQVHAINTLLNASQKKHTQHIDLIIWPEASFPFGISENTEWLHILKHVVPKNGFLIFGTDRYVKSANSSQSSWIAYNSIIAINELGEIIGIYDKKILVPFGEYIPWRKVLPTEFIEKVAYGIGDFAVGTNSPLLNLHINNNSILNIITTICYEGIFSHFITLDNNDSFLLNITNELWFGNSIGPYQHLAMARMRAIETGVPMIRVANTGISVVTNNYGKIIHSCALGQECIIDASLNTVNILNIYSLWYVKSIVTAVVCCVLLASIAWAELCFIKK